jgi:hypothetical protein
LHNILFFNGSMKNVGTYQAVYAPKLRITPATSTVWTIQDTLGSDVLLYTAAGAFNHPAESDVRNGVSYGTIYTGTCAVPPAASVVKDVPVDNTVGTYALYGDLIARLEQCSTVAITGQQIASYLT